MKRYVVYGGLFCAVMGAGLYISALQAQMAVPFKAGSTATVGQLFDYINKNNPAKTSNFLVLGADKKSSFGAAKQGFDQSWAKQNAGMVVTLQLDSAQEAATSGRNKKGPLLYFEVDGVRLYIFDPWPPLKVKTAKSKK